GGTNGQLLVEGLPTYPDSGNNVIGIVISKHLKPSRGIELHRIRSRNAHLGAGNRDLRLGKDAIRFAPAKVCLCLPDANLIAVLVLIIGVKIKLLPAPVSARSESNRSSRHFKQVGRVNVKVRRCQRRLRQVPDLCTSKQDRGNVGRKSRLVETRKR